MTRALLLLFVLASCRSAPRPCDGGSCGGSATTQRWEERSPYNADVLFIVDPRVLAGDPARLRAAMGDLGREFAKSPHALDLHFAAVSSVLDGNGQPVNLFSGPCAPKSGAFLTAGHRACAAPPNFDGTLDQALACLAATADGESQPLAVARRLLEPAGRPEAYRDLFRESSIRLVVIITARDDASPEPAADPAALGAYLDALSPIRRTALQFSLIVPLPVLADGGARCTLAPAEAPVSRLLALARTAEQNAVTVELCSGDWTRALAEAFSLVGTGWTLCLPPGVRAGDGAPPPDCLVRQLTPSPTGPVTTLVPRCASGPPPCWETREDFLCDSRAALVFNRDCLPPAGSELALTCATP